MPDPIRPSDVPEDPGLSAEVLRLLLMTIAFDIYRSAPQDAPRAAARLVLHAAELRRIAPDRPAFQAAAHLLDDMAAALRAPRPALAELLDLPPAGFA